MISLKQYGIIENEEEIETMNIDAWDYGRLAHIARISYNLGYINEEEAWLYILKAFSKVRGIYKTWLDYSKSYTLGRYYWNSNIADNLQDNMAHYSMIIYKKSIWNIYPLKEIYTEENENEYEKQKLKYKQVNRKNYKKINRYKIILTDIIRSLVFKYFEHKKNN